MPPKKKRKLTEEEKEGKAVWLVVILIFSPGNNTLPKTWDELENFLKSQDIDDDDAGATVTTLKAKKIP